MGSLADELIPEPRRSIEGMGVARAVQPLALAVRGFRMDARQALERAGLTVVGEGDVHGHELLIERTACAFPGVPAKAEAYRCAIGVRRSVIHAASEQGAWNGVATFLEAAELLGEGGAFREALIEDWPDTAWRGAILESTCGTDLMSLEDWRCLVDRLASLKMNVLGVDLCGSSGVPERGSQHLMVSVPGHPELQTPKAMRWYSPAQARWKELSGVPRMFAEDFFGELVAYGSSRGVRVLPSVGGPGHDALIPRLIPEVSARDDEGKLTGYGWCFADPRTWDLISSLLGSIIDRYLTPAGADAFHIRIGADRADPRRALQAECRCPSCRARPAAERIREWVARLAAFLAERGMRHVVIWGDEPSRGRDALDHTFSLGWANADPCHIFDLAVMGGASWCEAASAESVCARLARRLAGGRADKLEGGRAALSRAAANPSARIAIGGSSDPRRYPLEALEVIEAMGPEGRGSLEEMRSSAALALELLRAAEARPGRGALSSLLAEAARLSVYAEAFVTLLGVRSALASGRPAAAAPLPARVAAEKARVVAAMVAVEQRKPESLVPAALADLSVLYEFLVQLQGECVEVAASRRAPATVRWYVEDRSAKAPR